MNNLGFQSRDPVRGVYYAYLDRVILKFRVIWNERPLRALHGKGIKATQYLRNVR